MVSRYLVVGQLVTGLVVCGQLVTTLLEGGVDIPLCGDGETMLPSD